MLLQDSRGKRYQLSRIIGKGGQATVYRVAGNSAQLAKVYLRPQGQDEKKLAWMIHNPPDDPSAHLNHASIAWPLAILYKPDRSFAGYLMPYVKSAVPMLNVFNPRLRARTLTEFDPRYLHRTARNLAAALGALHARDYVVGDLNESNVMVTHTTLVTMIDTDSFQVRATPRGKPPVIYPCPVGKFEYLPPELQNRSLQDVYRLPEHDRFALAVLIFQLLMEGNHPFRAKWSRTGDAPPLEERIHAGWYPYRDGSVSSSGRLPVSPPDNAPPLTNLHPILVDLFQRCFILGHDTPSARPTPEEWDSAIAQAEKALRSCGRGHYFSSHLRACPRCGQEWARSRSDPDSSIAPPPVSPEELLAKMVAEHLKSERSQAASTAGQRVPAGGGQPVGLPAPPTASGRAAYRGNYAQVVRKMMKDLFGHSALFGFLGAGVGGLLGAEWTGPTAGSAVGIIGGLFAGGMMSETVEKRFSWAIALAFLGAVGSAFFVSQAGVPLMLWLSAGLLGGVVGFMVGYLGPPPFWLVVWALLGALAGNYFGKAMGSAVADGWAGGALSGGVSGAVTGAVYWAWRKFG